MAKELAKKEEEIKDLSIFEVEVGQEEQFSRDEVELPFLKLAQKGSAQVDEDKPEYIEGLKPGMFFNTVTGAIYGPEIKVQVHGYFHNYTIFEGPKGNGTYQGTMTTEEFRVFEKTNALTRDGGDMTHSVEGKDLRYQDTHNFIVYLPEHEEDGIMIYPLSSTGCKPARKWNTLQNGRRANGRPVKRYATLWELKTAGFESNGFPYKQVSSIRPNPLYREDCFVSADLMALGKSMEDFTKSIKENGVKYSDEKDTEEVPADSEF